MKKLILTNVLVLMLASTIFSQILFVDGLDYPFGDRGYNLSGEEYSIPEQINSATYTVVGYTNIEINEMYPGFISMTPNRGSATILNWHNDSDVGDWSPGGIHPGEDSNFGSVGDDTGLPVSAIANGTVFDFRALSIPISKSGWCVVLKHVMPDGSDFYSFYGHTTSADSISGGVCLNESDFGLEIGQEVVRGQIIARIGNVTSFGDHLHYEIRTWYDQELALWPNGPGGRYPESSEEYKFGISMENVALAYYEMGLDGIIDASDFIDANRPSLYATEYCFDPPIVWQNTIGGSGDDLLLCMNQTSDGGYILGGFSNSGISEDKTEESTDGDYWIVKLNNVGSIEWENTTGGNNAEYLYSIEQTSDGGYILGGYSYYSGISGDKTEVSIGNIDYWVVKLNNLGSIDWQNVIGGSGDDLLYCTHQTSDGGYILGGKSGSGISGDKSEENLGYMDYWVVKLNSAGLIQWQNTIGGTGQDDLTSITQTSDGGYILGGSSSSNISGDKNEEAITTGYTDYWVVKLNDIGNIEWQNTIGGTGSDYLLSCQETSDGGYILGGYSNSSVSADKSEISLGVDDYWIVKLNNIGLIEWQNTIGGPYYDRVSDIKETEDSGFIIIGSSNSAPGGDKTEPLIGYEDYWIVKTDNIGNIEWQNTIGGTNEDFPYTVEQTSDGGYVLGGWSSSGISGNKTESSLGYFDYWIVKLSCDENCIPTPETCNSLDDDCDGLVDDSISISITIDALGPITFCQGSSIVLTATHTGTSVQWYKNGTAILGATSLFYTASTSGSYTCIATAPCATATSNPITVTVNKNPTATITAGGTTTFCAGGSVTLTANAGGGLSYQWYKGAVAITGATNINYTATIAGNYKCRVTKTVTGCYKNSNVIPVSIVCKEGVVVESTILYPNPSSNKIYIDLSVLKNTNTDIVIINNLGQSVFSISVNENNIVEFDISSIPPGLYEIEIIQNGHIIHSEKFISQ